MIPLSDRALIDAECINPKQSRELSSTILVEEVKEVVAYFERLPVKLNSIDPKLAGNCKASRKRSTAFPKRSAKNSQGDLRRSSQEAAASVFRTCYRTVFLSTENSRL